MWSRTESKWTMSFQYDNSRDEPHHWNMMSLNDKKPASYSKERWKNLSSPWSFSVVVLTPKNVSPRLCVDYRQLRVRDALCLPRGDYSLATLSGSWWYSTLDLAMGYWQVSMDADTQEKAAFALSSGFCEWNVMPFGFATHPEHLRDWWILFWRTYIGKFVWSTLMMW